MDLLFDSLPALVSLGAGLAVLSGLRAFLPLAVVGLVSHLDLFGPLSLGGTPFGALENLAVILVLFGLALVEIVLDKFALADTVQDVVATPLRVIAGGIAFGACLADRPLLAVVFAMIAGAVIAGVVGGVKGFLRPGVTVVGGGTLNPFISLFEDLTALLGTLLLLLLPFLGVLLLAFLLYLVFRLRRRQQRKYHGLRVLKE